MITFSTRLAGLFVGAAALLFVGSTAAAEPEATVLGASLDAWNAAFGEPEKTPTDWSDVQWAIHHHPG